MEGYIGVLRAEKLDDSEYIKSRLSMKLTQFNIVSKMYKNNFETATTTREKQDHLWRLQEYQLTENTLYVALDRNKLTKENVEKIKKFTLEYVKKGYKVRVAIDDDIRKKNNDSKINYTYTQEEMDLLNELNSFSLQYSESEIKFNEVDRIQTLSDYHHSWGMSKVAKASEEVKKVAAYIKENNFSPFESMLYIHKWITAREYKENAFDISAARMLPSILSDGKFIVCSGYSSAVKAVVDELNMPGLKCDIVGADIIDGVFSHSGHAHNLVHINDEKYNINGSYIEDACWDCADLDSERFKQGKGYSCCLYPVADVLKFKDRGYYNEEVTSRYDAILSDSKYEERYFKAQPKGAIQESIFKLKEHQRTKGVPDIVEKYAKNSVPIPIETYVKGLHKVYKVSGLNSQEAEKEVKKDIAISLDASIDRFSPTASNQFSKQIDKRKRREQKNQDKISRF